MDQLPSGSVDLIVTSPPYNIGKEYETVKPLDDYLSWTQNWINKSYKLLKPNGSFWLNLGYYNGFKGQALPLTYCIYPLIKNFKLVQEVVWHYGAGVNYKNMFSPRHENWMLFVKDLEDYTFNLDAVRDKEGTKYPNQKKNGKLRCNPLGKNPGDVWIIKKVTSGTNRSSPERTAHPAQFPEEVIQRILRVSSNEGDLVLDPFVGSGTTMKVAKELNRNSVGIEINPRYKEIVDKRLNLAQSRLDQS
ncbi:site-specific DNA-methyltransferase [Candidatus Micrarchaeota archaeon]|nr:site-specific DNA-methyltransferase [Candidatus Micrarchaeota archaeon]